MSSLMGRAVLALLDAEPDVMGGISEQERSQILQFFEAPPGDCCEELRAEIQLIKAEIERLKGGAVIAGEGGGSTSEVTPTPNNCLLEFSTWDLSNGVGDARLRASDGRLMVLSLSPQGNARIDWKGNNSAQRDIPLSQAFNPDVQGVSTFRAQFTWDTSPEQSGAIAANDAGFIECEIALEETMVNPAFYIENLGQAIWTGSANLAYSAMLRFENSDGIKILSGPPHLMASGRSLWRSVGGPAQDLGRSTDDDFGEAAGWIQIIGEFGPTKPIQFVVAPAESSIEGRGQDAIAFTIPFLTCG